MTDRGAVGVWGSGPSLIGRDSALALGLALVVGSCAALGGFWEEAVGQTAPPFPINPDASRLDEVTPPAASEFRPPAPAIRSPAPSLTASAVPSVAPATTQTGQPTLLARATASQEADGAEAGGPNALIPLTGALVSFIVALSIVWAVRRAR